MNVRVGMSESMCLSVCVCVFVVRLSSDISILASCQTLKSEHTLKQLPVRMRLVGEGERDTTIQLWQPRLIRCLNKRVLQHETQPSV